MDCPDPKLCEDLGWHCHGHVYHLYLTRADYRQKIDAQAGREPSLLTKLQNFDAALARHAANGLKQVSDDTLQARKAVCGPCPERTERDTCRKCGCNLAMKVAWASERCPLNKWPA